MRSWLSGITAPCQGAVGVSITPDRTVLLVAPVAQWIEYRSSEPWMWVRFLPGAQIARQFFLGKIVWETILSGIEDL